MFDWLLHPDSIARDSGEAIIFITAVSVALAGLLKFRPVKWLWRTVVSEPLAGFFQRNTQTVLRADLGVQEGDEKIAHQIKALRGADESTTAMIENLHRCLDRRSAETHALIAKVSEYAERIYAESVGSKDRIRHLYRTLDVPVFEADTHGFRTYVNPAYCKLTGLSVDEALGQGWLASVRPDERDRVLAAWDHAINARQDLAFTYHVINAKSGAFIESVVSATPLHDGEGEIVGWVGTIEPTKSTSPDG